MKLIKPSFEILEIMGADSILTARESLRLIELAGRVCYKSEDKITENSDKKFVERIKASGHHSVLEHSAMTVRFICDRGVTHEFVRHRLCAFSQESTRYCNYKGGVTFVIPPWIDYYKPGEYDTRDYPRGEQTPTWDWFNSLVWAEAYYINLLRGGWTPQQARSVLPNSLKTEIVVTANFREWMHIFSLRCAKAAHPQMREIMIPLRDKCRELIPIIFSEKETEK